MTERLLQFFSRTEIWVGGLAVAAFLVLYWTLRGAPPGQATGEEGEEAPSSGYRDRVVAGVVVGLLLVMAATYIAVARSVAWSLPVFALGFGLVLALIAANQRHRHASPVLRRTVELSNVALTATLVAGVLMVVNVLAFRYGGRALDFTREESFSLSSLTLNQLKALDRPVTFTVLFGEGPQAGPQLGRVKELLELYQAASPSRVRIEYVNPFVELEKMDALVKRVPDLPVLQDGGVLVEYGAGESPPHALVRNIDLFEWSRPGGDIGRFESAFRGEDAVTSKLIALREERKPRIVFTAGHGEPSIDSGDLQRPGLGLFRARLTAIGSEVAAVALLEREVPAETSLLVVVAPRTPFTPDEVARVRSYLDGGGPALFLLGNTENSGLDDLLRSYNVAIGKGVVVDPRFQARGRPGLVYVPILGMLHHPIVDPLVNRFVLIPAAAPLQILGAAGARPVNPGLSAVALLQSTASSWAETERTVAKTPGQDVGGPLVVGVAVSDRPPPGVRKEGPPRLVLFSSGAMADNFILQNEPTNLDLLINAVGWLRGRAELKGIEPKKHIALTLTADPVLRVRLLLVPTVMAILFILGMGATTYAARRE